MVMFLNRVLKRITSLFLRKGFAACGSDAIFEWPGNIEGSKYITIGKRCDFQRGLFLTAYDQYSATTPVQHFKPAIIIGDDCHIGAWNHITCVDRIEIGSGLLTGKWVTISDNSHGVSCYASMSLPPRIRPVVSKGPVVIGQNVWIGDKATILPGVKVGDGAIIGANSVVTKNVPAFSVVAGIPAKVVKRCGVQK